MPYARPQRFKLVHDLVDFIIFQDDADKHSVQELNDTSECRYISIDKKVDEVRANTMPSRLPSLHDIMQFITWLNIYNSFRADNKPICFYILKSNAHLIDKKYSCSKNNHFSFNARYLSNEILAIYLLCCWQIVTIKKPYEESLVPFGHIFATQPIYQIATHAPHKWWEENTNYASYELHSPKEAVFLKGGTTAEVNTHVVSEIDSWDDITDYLAAFEKLQDVISSWKNCSAKHRLDTNIFAVVKNNLAIVRHNLICEHDACRSHIATCSNVSCWRADKDRKASKSSIVVTELIISNGENDKVQCVQSLVAEFGNCLQIRSIRLDEIEVDDSDVAERDCIVQFMSEKKNWLELLKFLKCCHSLRDYLVIKSDSPDLPLWILGVLLIHHNVSINEALAWYDLCFTTCGFQMRRHLYLLRKWEGVLIILRRKYLRSDYLMNIVAKINRRESSLFCEKLRERIRIGKLWLDPRELHKAHTHEQSITCAANNGSCLPCDRVANCLISSSTRAAQLNKKKTNKRDLRTRLKLPQRNDMEIATDEAKRKTNTEALCRFLYPLDNREDSEAT